MPQGQSKQLDPVCRELMGEGVKVKQKTAAAPGGAKGTPPNHRARARGKDCK